MLYYLLKPIVRLAMFIFCRRVIIDKPALLKIKGPLLLACNHPNSFLDAVVLDTLFKQPVWSLARGDVFKNNFIAQILRSLRILPVYRTSEGVENLSENYKTFAECISIFKQDGIVQIFSEGQCINEWHLRPLKKGTARLAIQAWEENIPLKVLPIGLNYSSYYRFGKNIILNLGEIITIGDIDMDLADGLRHQAFNNLLQEQLKKIVLEIPKHNLQKQSELLELKPSRFKKIVLALPAAIGWLVHLPLYIPVKNTVAKKTNHNDHYDSLLTGILLVMYPLYLASIVLALWLITTSTWSLALLLLMPLSAWSYVQLKPQMDKISLHKIQTS